MTMKRKVKMIIWVVSIVLVLVAIVAGYFWYVMGRPLYEPGMVRAGSNLRASLTPPKQSPEPSNDGHFWNVEADIQLDHFSEGGGSNVLIVHGGPGVPSAKPWVGLEPLTKNYRFHYYDQRGCGRSTRPIDRFSSTNVYENMTTLDKTLGLGAQVADIERIRQILGEEKLILIGHSWGGFLTSLYAAEFPERVAALVLIGPANVLVMPPEGGGLLEEVKMRLPENMQADYAAYLKDYLDFRNIFSKSETDLIALNQEFAKYYTAVVRTSIPEGGKAGGWMVQAMYFSMGRRHDYRGALRDMKAPVLVIHGADDLQTEQESRTYADAFPNSRFRIIENAGHFPFHEQPERFSAAISEFLNGLK